MDNQPKENLVVAMVQYQIIWNNSHANMEKIGEMLHGINLQLDIIILPEAFNTGFNSDPAEMAETMDGKTVQWMRQLAKDRNCAVCGSLFIKEDGKFFNRFLWVLPEGVAATYDKRHLYSIGGEDKFITQGTVQTLIEYKGWKIRPQICYDLRFPVWIRNTDNYDIMINVSAWPSSKAEIRRTLLRARSIENQCYTIGVNNIGSDENNLTYNGLSLVSDAVGKEIANAGESEKVEIAVLDYSTLQNFRGKFNTLRDKDKFEIFL